ncbi:hypothetical protein Tco_0475768 [Tanacetum coccineum]
MWTLMMTGFQKIFCEPESNDSSSPTSTIVEEFDSLVGEIIKQKEEVKEISDPVARRRVCFSKLENFRIIHQGRVIHSPKIASVMKSSQVMPWKGVVRFGKKGKLAPRFVGPFEIIKKVGHIAYMLDLPEELDGVHDTFHVSNLKKCWPDPTLQVPLDEIQVEFCGRACGNFGKRV